MQYIVLCPREAFQHLLYLSLIIFFCGVDFEQQPGEAEYTDNTPIEKVDNFGFLGVCLDSNLKWDGHIQFLATKLGKYTGI